MGIKMALKQNVEKVIQLLGNYLIEPKKVFQIVDYFLHGGIHEYVYNLFKKRKIPKIDDPIMKYSYDVLYADLNVFCYVSLQQILQNFIVLLLSHQMTTRWLRKIPRFVRK